MSLETYQQARLHTYASAWRAYHETKVLCSDIAAFARIYIAQFQCLPDFDADDPTIILVCRSITGMSQSEFAEALGVHRQTISRWECGLTKPKGEHVEQLREFYRRKP